MLYDAWVVLNSCATSTLAAVEESLDERAQKGTEGLGKFAFHYKVCRDHSVNKFFTIDISMSLFACAQKLLCCISYVVNIYLFRAKSDF